MPDRSSLRATARVEARKPGRPETQSTPTETKSTFIPETPPRSLGRSGRALPGAEVLGSLRGDDEDVLEADPEMPGEVQARLVGERHAGLERHGAPRIEVGILVSLE